MTTGRTQPPDDDDREEFDSTIHRQVYCHAIHRVALLHIHAIREIISANTARHDDPHFYNDPLRFTRDLVEELRRAAAALEALYDAFVTGATLDDNP